MRVGTFCYATEQGLGYLARDFYRAGVVTDVFVIKHDRRENKMGWYPGACSTLIRKPNMELLREWVSQMDVMLFFETPFYWDIIPFCQEHGIKTVLMPMYECMPEALPQLPDMILCPSKLDHRYYQHYPEIYPHLKIDVQYLPVPVPSEIKWKPREFALTFVHNAGHGGLRGRNGTAEILDALRYVETPARFIIRSQDNLGLPSHVHRMVEDRKVKLEIGSKPWELLYSEGDVFLFPEKFNGLSLPMQEARASGMLVMGANRFPMNKWLPTQPLIPVKRYDKARISNRCLEFDEAVICPLAIAKTIDEWYGRDITSYSLSGLEWAETMQWDLLKPKYLKALEP